MIMASGVREGASSGECTDVKTLRPMFRRRFRGGAPSPFSFVLGTSSIREVGPCAKHTWGPAPWS